MNSPLLLDGVTLGDPRGIAGEERVDIPVSHVPGGDRRLSARLSGRPPAVEDEMGRLVVRQNTADNPKLVGWNIDRAGNAALLELIFSPSVHDEELSLPVDQAL